MPSLACASDNFVILTGLDLRFWLYRRATNEVLGLEADITILFLAPLFTLLLCIIIQVDCTVDMDMDSDTSIVFKVPAIC